MSQGILAFGAISGAFSDIPMGTKLLFIAIIAAVIFASKGGKGGSGNKSGGSSGAAGGSAPTDVS